MRIRSNNNREGHITQIMKRAIGGMKQVWSIGERRFNGDFKTIMIMFDAIV